ncbi:alkaline shock response membrane anchor protein AmaP [Lactococcus lactis]|uniref:alkaline shock response membrane anchor protein AmaP n=1 Tax=Lactococcus lactis TaxID=1358 RepID=UPI0025A27D70|nr:alkaline shock response membrane anchor protein AmaP [Lactococcus lactis]MDM7651173.1 alkaline shock response membrane anchor protein AmaP [Lactococcus lactis]
MSKGKKFIFILADLFFLTILIPILWDYFNYMNFRWELMPSSEIPYIGNHLSQYIFISSSILGALLLICLLILIFYPKTYQEVLLDDKTGNLTLKVSAIEGLVREIIPRVEIVEKTKEIEQEIKESIQNFFGINYDLKLKIKVSSLAENKSSTSRRVE